MTRIKKIFCILIFILCFAILPNVVNGASDFKREALDFTATLNEDGSMDVVEMWEIQVYGTTNTLFRTFEIDNSKYSGITNVEVMELMSDGGTKDFIEIDDWMNHVPTEEFFGLENPSGEFEIAWGINVSSGRKIYQISYKVNDVVTVYNDVAELYWQFVGDGSNIPADEVTGKVILPGSVSNLDNLRAWAHGPLNGDIEITSRSTVDFIVKPYSGTTFIEVRVGILEPEMFYLANTKSDTDKLESILEEEIEWAEEANIERERIKQQEQNIKMIVIAISGVVGAIFLVLSVKHFKKLKEIQKIEPTVKYDYFREIPNEKSTPAEVGHLYYYGKASVKAVMSKILSATMLDLAMEKYISFSLEDKKFGKKEVTIHIEPGKDAGSMKSSKRSVYSLLKKVVTEDNSFTMKDFEVYAKKNNTTFLEELDSIERSAKGEQKEENNLNLEGQTQKQEWANKAVALGGLFLFVEFFVAVLTESFLSLYIAGVPVLLYFIICFTISRRYIGLSQKGLDEQTKLNGLKRFMDDFSTMDQREVPELVLWEKYMVYATIFGNADKVLEQLKVKYPEFSDSDYMMNHTTYFYLMSQTNFNTSFVNSINTSAQRAYQSSVAASNAASGGGYGGGFSGGGRWRSAAVEVLEVVKPKECPHRGRSMKTRVK